jgi:hypothetical protein
MVKQATLKSILRNRLKVRKNPAYLRYLSEKYKGMGLQRDHLLESVHGLKLNDLLISMKKPEAHMKKHYQAGAEDFESDLIASIDELCDYVEHLQGKNK